MEMLIKIHLSCLTVNKIMLGYVLREDNGGSFETQDYSIRKTQAFAQAQNISSISR